METKVEDQTRTVEPEWMRDDVGTQVPATRPQPGPYRQHEQARVVREDAPVTGADQKFYSFHTPQIGELVAALAAAQGEFTRVEKNMEREVRSKRNDMKFTLQWATLDEFLSVVRPVLSSQGLALLQLPQVGKDYVIVKTVLAKGEQMLWNFCVAPTETRDAWGVTSATTYARKTGLASLLGIAADADDEGEGAMRGREAQPERREPPKPAARPSQQPRPAAPPKAAEAPEKPAKEPAPAPAKPADDANVITIEGRVTDMATRSDEAGMVVFVKLDTGLKAWTRDTAMAVALESHKEANARLRVVARKVPGASPTLVSIEVVQG